MSLCVSYSVKLQEVRHDVRQYNMPVKNNTHLFPYTISFLL
nr:MAG TPA: hypothetical protein [Caudoviricetes sp.]